MAAYFEAFRRYFDFHGRSGRREFWIFFLGNLLVASALRDLLGDHAWTPRLFSTLVFIPTLAVSVRRLHDIGRSGWWMLLNLIPGLGQIVLLVMMLIESKPDMNVHGPVPTSRWATAE